MVPDVHQFILIYTPSSIFGVLQLAFYQRTHEIDIKFPFKTLL